MTVDLDGNGRSGEAQLNEVAQLSGTVYWDVVGGRRAQYAVVRASSETGEPVVQLADDDGDFAFENLPPGNWQLVALHEKGTPAKPVDQKLVAASSEHVNLTVPAAVGVHNEEKGRRLFWLLIGGLAVLFIVYIALHMLPTIRAPLSRDLVAEINRVQQLLSAEEAVDQAVVIEAIDDVGDMLGVVLGGAETLTAADTALINARYLAVREAIEDGQTEAALSELQRLVDVIEIPPTPSFGIWREEPLWFLEVLFWAFAGILVKKIFDVSYYVRNRRFFPEGVIMHIGHIIAVPLLVLVVLFLLSQVTLALSVGTSTLQLDLDNPLLLAAAAFLLALNPWGLLSYLSGVSERILGSGDDPD